MKFYKRLCAGAAVIALAGCAGLPGSKTPEEAVMARAQARIDALRAADFELALTYNTPGYQEVFGPRELARRYAGVPSWQSAVVDQAVCSQLTEPGTEGSSEASNSSTVDRCEISMTIEYTMVRQNMPMVRLRKETWLLVNGEWYIDPE